LRHFDFLSFTRRTVSMGQWGVQRGGEMGLTSSASCSSSSSSSSAVASWYCWYSATRSCMFYHLTSLVESLTEDERRWTYGLCLCELHLVHSLSGVPMQESLALEHETELISHTTDLTSVWEQGRENGTNRLKSSWIAVEFPMKVTAILTSRGAMSQCAVWTLLGIHSAYGHRESVYDGVGGRDRTHRRSRPSS
jgi:hypothetical protein